MLLIWLPFLWLPGPALADHSLVDTPVFLWLIIIIAFLLLAVLVLVLYRSSSGEATLVKAHLKAAEKFSQLNRRRAQEPEPTLQPEPQPLAVAPIDSEPPSIALGTSDLILHQVLHGGFLFNLENRSFTLDPKCRQILGLGEDLHSITLEQFCSALDPAHQKQVQAIFQHPHQSPEQFDFDVRVGDRTEGHYFRFLGRRQTLNGEPEIIGLFWDISSRKSLEDELASAGQMLKTVNQKKTRFLSNINREITDPVNAIMGLVDITLHTHLTLEQREYIEKIQYTCQAINNLISDIQGYNQMDSGEMRIDYSPFSLMQVVNQLKATYQVQAQLKGITLEFLSNDDSPMYLKGDARRLFQILSNLLSNAVKFTREGSVIFSYSAQAKSQQENQFVFRVQDNGPGIPDHKKHTLLHHGDIFTLEGGSGIGLTIASHLCRLMGGTINVDTSSGHGSTFVVTLPFEAISENTYLQSQASELGQQNQFRMLAEGKVLVVEDNDINQEVVKEMLSNMNLTSYQAANGLEAIHLLETGLECDLILMDLEMPGLNGIETTKYLRSKPRFKHLPIVALTATTVSADLDASMEAGMNDSIYKPVNPSDLYRVLSYWLTKRGQATENSAQVSEAEPCYVDWSVGMKNHGGDKDRYTDALKTFHQQHQQVMAEISLLVENQQLDVLDEQLASFANAANNLGLKPIAQHCTALKYSSHHNMAASQQYDLEQLAKVLRLTHGAIQRRLGYQSDNDPLDIQALNEWLLALEDHLQKCRYLDDADLLPLTTAAENSLYHHSELKQLHQLITQFDFDEASVLAAEILAHLQRPQSVNSP